MDFERLQKCFHLILKFKNVYKFHYSYSIQHFKFNLYFPNNVECARSLNPTFATPRIAVHKAPLSMEFSRHAHCSWSPFSYPGDLPNPGIEPASPTSPALAGGFFTNNKPWVALYSASIFKARIHGRVHEALKSPPRYSCYLWGRTQKGQDFLLLRFYILVDQLRWEWNACPCHHNI